MKIELHPDTVQDMKDLRQLIMWHHSKLAGMTDLSDIRSCTWTIRILEHVYSKLEEADFWLPN